MINVELQDFDEIVNKTQTPAEKIKEAFSTEQTLHFNKTDFEYLSNQDVNDILDSHEFKLAKDKLKSEFLYIALGRESKDYLEDIAAKTDYRLMNHEQFGTIHESGAQHILNQSVANGDKTLIDSVLNNPKFNQHYRTDRQILESQINNENKKQITEMLSSTKLFDTSLGALKAGFYALERAWDTEDAEKAIKGIHAVANHYPDYYPTLMDNHRARWLDVERKTYVQYELFSEPKVFDTLNDEQKTKLITNNIYCHRNGMYNHGFDKTENGFLEMALTRQVMSKEQLHMATDAVIIQEDMHSLKSIMSKTRYEPTQEQLDTIKGNWSNSKEFFEFYDKAKLNNKLTEKLAPRTKTKSLKI